MISLVTTVLNDREGCVRFFAAMAAQTRPPAAIVIVDGGSTDGTWEFLQEKSGGRVKVLRDEGCNVARGRNLAIKAASHELIVSTDIGCEWEPQWLEELVAPLLRDEECEAVMGSWSVRPEDLSGDWAKVEFALLDGPKMLATSRDHASSRAIAFRRALWERIGGYPEDLTLAADDMVYALLLHATTSRVAAAPVPRCHWERPARLKSFAKEARRNFRGGGEAGIWLKHGVLVGARLIAELLFPILALVLIIAGSAASCVALLGVAVASAGLRWMRLQPAIRRARALGVTNPTPRILVFDYWTKVWGIIGYWEGVVRGFEQTRECRQRLRRAGISWA